MPAKGKQADRRAKQKGSNEPEQDEASGSSTTSSLKEVALSLVMGSAIVASAPSIPDLVKEGIDIMKGEKPACENKVQEKEAEKENEDSNGTASAEHVEKEETGKENDPASLKSTTSFNSISESLKSKDVSGAFKTLTSQLNWANPLGLSGPTTVEESKKSFIAMTQLEFDGGPKARRRGNPGLDRITSSLTTHVIQYLHFLLLLMTARAWLFRSFFACLPCVTFWQYASVYIPLDRVSPDNLPAPLQAPLKDHVGKVPLEKVPVHIRFVITVVLNALVLLFFVYELLVQTYILEKIPLIGLIVYHAYAFRPVNQ